MIEKKLTAEEELAWDILQTPANVNDITQLIRRVAMQYTYAINDELTHNALSADLIRLLSSRDEISGFKVICDESNNSIDKTVIHCDVAIKNTRTASIMNISVDIDLS